MMSDNDLMMALLTSIGYRVPILIALGVALVMLLGAPRGRVRMAALTGVSLLLATTLVGGVLTVLPLLFISSGNYQYLSSLNPLLGILQMARALVEALGLGVMAWALTKALRAPIGSGPG